MRTTFLHIAVVVSVVFNTAAATRTWTGASPTTGNWTDAANWASVIAPAAGDDLVFSTTATKKVCTNNFASGTSFRSITFLGTSYSIRGNPFVISRGITNAAGVGNSILQDWQPGANISIVNGSGGTLTCNGAIALGAFTIASHSDGEVSLTGVISGSGGVTVTGSGLVRYSGLVANTYTGTTTVDGGASLHLQRLIFDLGGNVRGLISIAGPLFIRSGTALLNQRDQLADTVPVTINQGGLFNFNNFSDEIGAVTMRGGVLRTGSGTVTLNGNVHSQVEPDPSPTVFSYIDGNIALGANAHTFDVDLEAHLALGTISGSSTVTKTGPGSMAIAGGTYTGGTTIDEGELRITAAGGLGAATAGTVIDGGRLHVSSNGYAAAESMTIVSGTLEFSGSGTWAGAININNAATIQAGRTTIPPFDNTVAVITGAITGSGSLRKTGVGTLELAGAGANTYAGPTTVAQSTLTLRKPAGVQAVGGDVTVTAASQASGFLRLMADNQIPDSSAVTVGGIGMNMVDRTETIASLAGGSEIELGAGLLTVGGNNQSTTYSGPINGAGGRLTKVGTGTLTLNGTHTYTGATTVQAGELFVNGSITTSAVTLNGFLATLGGNGQVGAVNSVQGVIAPGLSPGTLRSSSVTLSAASLFNAEVLIDSNGITPDVLQVAGTVNLTGSQFIFSPTFGSGYSLREGIEFVIIDNDGTDAIVGTFQNLPQGSTITRSGIDYRLSYTGGSGNDVSLTFTDVGVRYVGSAVLAGNGDGAIDPDECNLLYLTITNTGSAALSGVSATLTSLSPNVSVLHATSAYPDIPANGGRSNITAFQISTPRLLPCGTTLPLELDVTFAAGRVVVPISLPTSTGSGATAATYSDSPNTVIGTPTDYFLVVSNLNFSLGKLVVALHATHGAVNELDFSLIGPDGTTVILSSDNGGTGNDYGTGCLRGDMTRFDDDASSSITAGTAPFRAAFRPEQPLAAFRGKSGDAINGVWTLRAVDDSPLQNSGQMKCWSLSFAPCPTDGGGECLSGTGASGSLTTNSAKFPSLTAVQPHIGRAPPSSCDTPAVCPVSNVGLPARRWEVVTFTNTHPAVCIKATVELLNSCQFIWSAAYAHAFDPSDKCLNYIGHSGRSASFGQRLEYSFIAPAYSTYVILVEGNDVACQADFRITLQEQLTTNPELLIAPVDPSGVRLIWPTAAAGFQLERTPQLAPPAWFTVPAQPTAHNGQFILTNSAAPPSGFFRLHRP